MEFINQCDISKWVLSSKYFHQFLVETFFGQSSDERKGFLESFSGVFFEVDSNIWMLIELIDKSQCSEYPKGIFMHSHEGISHCSEFTVDDIIDAMLRIEYDGHSVA